MAAGQGAHRQLAGLGLLGLQQAAQDLGRGLARLHQHPDLRSAVEWLVGTGGALTRVPGGEAILRAVATGAGGHLLPPPEVRVLIDREYLFSALGTLAQAYPGEVRATFHKWVEPGS